MELKKHFSPKIIFLGLYVLAFLVYIVFGLQPVDAINYNITSNLSIPSIGLKSDVTKLSLEDNKLDTPNAIVGSYSENKNKTLLVGHSTTVFKDLADIEKGSTINYNDKTYIVTKRKMILKSHISMEKLLKEEKSDTLIIMTCAGELYGNGDATHRLIITAKILD